MEYEVGGPPPNLFLLTQLSENSLSELKKQIKIIESNFDNFSDKKANNTLAGNLEKEYSLSEKSILCLNEVVAPYVKKFNEVNPLLNSIKVLDENLPLILDRPWVNFQKKYEFNPVHNHKGIFSFVLWLKIPYYLKDEMKNPSSVNSNNNCPGHFELLYTDIIGRIQTHKIPVDKNMENYLLVFPSQTYHCVYPFYTSDEYRISVSGNYVFKTQ